MFLLLPAVALGIIAGFVLGGSLARLAHLPLHYGWLAIISFVIQVVVFTSFFRWLQLAPHWVPWLHIFTLLLLLAMVVANRRLLGIRILGLGLLLNVLAITANGGFMPISPDVMHQIGLDEEVAILRERGTLSKSILMTPETRLSFLGDQFSIDAPYARRKVFSIGDAIIAVGAFVLVPQGMTTRRRRWDWT